MAVVVIDVFVWLFVSVCLNCLFMVCVLWSLGWLFVDADGRVGDVWCLVVEMNMLLLSVVDTVAFFFVKKRSKCLCIKLKDYFCPEINQ
jgi:hypothetical protein